MSPRRTGNRVWEEEDESGDDSDFWSHPSADYELEDARADGLITESEETEIWEAIMRLEIQTIMLVRVGADQSEGGGVWNGPVDLETGEFAYVPIPESMPVHSGLAKPYTQVEPILAQFGVTLPAHLRARSMHLDPDFEHLTYGDLGGRGRQIRARLSEGGLDMIVFYAALRDIRGASRLIYAIIGVFEVERLLHAAYVPADRRDQNAHTRRILNSDAQDVIVQGRPRWSGRLEKCLPIGEYRDRAYRVRSDLIDEWGGLSNKDGYLQRSARLPLIEDPVRFRRWLNRQQSVLIQANN